MRASVLLLLVSTGCEAIFPYRTAPRDLDRPLDLSGADRPGPVSDGAPDSSPLPDGGPPGDLVKPQPDLQPPPPFTLKVSWADSVTDPGLGVAVDAADTAYVVGKGGKGVMIARRDAAGNWLTKSYGTGHLGNRATAVAVQDQLFVTGQIGESIMFGNHQAGTTSHNSVLLASFATDTLTPNWAKAFGASSDTTTMGHAVAASASRVCITGSYRVGFLGLPTCTQDTLFVACFDHSGNLEWARSGGCDAPSYGRGIGLDTAGNVYLAGFLTGSLTLESQTITAAGGPDLLIGSLTISTGGLRWLRRFGDSSNQYAYALAVNSSGVSCITGPFRGQLDLGGGHVTHNATTEDLYLACFDSSGGPLGLQAFNNPNGVEYGQGIALDGQGRVFVTGFYSGSPSLGGSALPAATTKSILVGAYQATGGHLASYGFGGVGPDFGWAIAVDSHGGVLVTGALGGQATFDGTPVSPPGFLVKLSP